MKKNFIIALILGLVLSCGGFCTHIHTEECGENGENCTHICDDSSSYGLEQEKPGL